MTEKFELNQRSQSSQGTVFTVGDYQFNYNAKLGEGGFGAVYRGHQISDPNHKVAIKIVQNERESRTLAKQEIEILTQLTRLNHPNLMKLYYFKETDSEIFLVLEFCNGGDLNRYLKKMGKLSERKIKIFLKQIITALEVIYANDIMHRDLKPANVLLVHDGENYPEPEKITLKLGDFGIARFLNKDNFLKTKIGTPIYAAPEVFKGRGYDRKADMYSLGMIIYELLTKDLAFDRTQRADQVVQVPRDTSNELKDLLRGLLNYNKTQRYSFDDVKRHPFIRNTLSNSIRAQNTRTTVTHAKTLQGDYSKSVDWRAMTSSDTFPVNAIHAGEGSDGTRFYIGRCEHNGGLYPCKVNKRNKSAYVNINGQEIRKTRFEILIYFSGKIRWNVNSHRAVPSNAIVGGKSSGGETLYIGRTKNRNGGVSVGGIRQFPANSNTAPFNEILVEM